MPFIFVFFPAAVAKAEAALPLLSIRQSFMEETRKHSSLWWGGCWGAFISGMRNTGSGLTACRTKWDQCTTTGSLHWVTHPMSACAAADFLEEHFGEQFEQNIFLPASAWINNLPIAICVDGSLYIALYPTAIVQRIHMEKIAGPFCTSAGKNASVIRERERIRVPDPAFCNIVALYTNKQLQQSWSTIPQA